MGFVKFSEKLISRQDLIKKVEELKKEGKKIVFTNGCFDLIHIGHVVYLREAKALGDVLIVAINTDDSIRKIKGDTRPILNQSERERVLAAFDVVDFVTSFDEESSEPIIREIKPDILVKGGDYSKEGIVGNEYVESIGGTVKPLQMVPGVSTSEIINLINKRFSEAK